MWVAFLLQGCAGPPSDLRGPTILEPTLGATGEVTWTASFDETATAAGYVDCTYTRHYAATEDRSTPWLCPDCDVVLAATSTMSDADRACYRWVAGGDPSPEERLGWDGDRFLRAGVPFAPLVELGLRTDSGGSDRVAFEGETDPLPLEAGTVRLRIAGELETATTIADPWNGMAPPPAYACGWPVRDPAPYEGTWTLEVGAVLPDGWFRDTCDEPVRLHDFVGRYMVIDMAAVDCGPCQSMAAGEPAFSNELRGLGIDVADVTLLARSLDDPLTPADPEVLRDWREAFELGSVVLGDRGWGYAMSAGVWPESLSYPSWFVVSPSLEVIAVGQGYGGWNQMKAAILDHWSR